MSTISKVFTVLNLVFALFLVGTNAAMLSKSEEFRLKYEAEQTEHAATRADLTEQISKLQADNANFENEVRQQKNQLNDRDSALATANSTADQLRADNAQLRNAVDSINESLKTVKSELADVQARNKELMDSNEQHRAKAAQAEQDMLDAQDDRARIEGDLERANADIAAKEKQLVELTSDRDNKAAMLAALEKIGVHVNDLIGNNVPQIEGKVSAVGPGFVVLSVGENEGVQIGFPFDVYRGNDYIGRVVVDNVLPDSSTARIHVRNKDGLPFQALDNATTRL